MNPYEILGVSVECTQEEITVAYRALAKKHHPDKGGDQSVFIQLSIAVDVLRDPHKRKLFDEFGIVMDATESMIAGKVEEMFNNIVNEWINIQINSGKEINLTDFCENGFNAASLRVQSELNKNESIIKVLTKRKGKIKTTDATNKIAAILENRISSIRSAIKAAEEEKYILSLVKDMCALYSSEEDICTVHTQHTNTRDFMAQVLKEQPIYGMFTNGGFV